MISVTLAELPELRELPPPTFTQRDEIIDGERVMLPALPPDLVPGALLTTLCVYDECGRAWEVVRLGDLPCDGDAWAGRRQP